MAGTKMIEFENSGTKMILNPNHKEKCCFPISSYDTVIFVAECIFLYTT